MNDQGGASQPRLDDELASRPTVEILVTTDVVPTRASWPRKLWWSAWAIVVEYLPLTDDVLGSVEETTFTVRNLDTGEVRTSAYERLSPADRDEAIAHLDRTLNHGSPDDVARFFADDVPFIVWA